MTDFLRSFFRASLFRPAIGRNRHCRARLPLPAAHGRLWLSKNTHPPHEPVVRRFDTSDAANPLALPGTSKTF